MLLAALSGLGACGSYNVKNLAKSDIDLVADEAISETRRLVRELTVKLYRRNPAELEKIPGMTIEGRLAQLKVNERKLSFPELQGRQGIDAMNLAFAADYRGDRVFALVAGLGGMLRQAYDFRPEFFMVDQLNAEALSTSARNVEVLVWKLKSTRYPDGRPYLISHEHAGVVDNLSFERLFGKLIALQDLLARVAADADDRLITSAVHTASTVFIPLPI
ncbi:hypothetical protein FVW59_11235 [Parahaliea aestuarii]|uniref:Uncharacterized protein n=1 Tax=Parahaliea aestuarii TaxID=1852021 RepID=A0A5C8ZTL5_9GAMM|nr:hypothetical protein FVW59_11235 [Parahaliea aestuarii]